MIDLVSSSIIMLPYCKSLWQKPISWSPSDKSFSSMFISSSKLSNPNFFISFEEHKLLAWLSQFLVKKKIHKKKKHQVFWIAVKFLSNFGLTYKLPHSLPKLSILWTRHMKIVELSHLRCYQSRYFQVSEVCSWECLKSKIEDKVYCHPQLVVY